MKESTLATKIMMGVLCVGVLLYLGIYFLLGFQDNLVTTTAYEATVDVGTEASGILVRDETVISASGQYVDVLLAEGEKVSKGGEVALLYSDSSAQQTLQEIKTLEAEIQQLEYALSSGTQETDSSKLDSQVITSIVNLRALTASGDLSSLEDSTLNLRTMVFKRDYTYGDTEAATQISQLIAQKQSQLATLNQSLSQVSQGVYAPVSGIFSGQVDGYESLITPDMLSTITVQELSALVAQEPPTVQSAVGKIITNSTWYLAAILEGEDIPGLQENKNYTVFFSYDYYGSISMKLERMETGDGVTLAIFSANTHMSDTTLLRVQTVDVITQQIQGIRIPRKALRVETETVTNEDGSQSQVNTYKVYTVVGTQAEGQEVRVLHTDDNFYLVEPVDPDASSRLRAGDEIILNTADIYDGKVVR